MVITETSERIFQYGMRIRIAQLDDFPLAYMLTYEEANEFYRDLLANPMSCLGLFSHLSTDMSVERFNDFYPDQPPPPPRPRSGRVLWCKYKGVTLAIKGDQDE